MAQQNEIKQNSASTLFDSAHNGDFERVKILVDEDPSLVKRRDNNERILLHWAALSGNVQLVTYLIEQKSQVHSLDDTNTTPLILASSAGRDQVVEAVLNHGDVDVNWRTTNGHSALQYAASKGLFEICLLLLTNGANANICDNRGATPLHRAASKGHVSIVNLLLINQRPARPFLSDDETRSKQAAASEELRRRVTQDKGEGSVHTWHVDFNAIDADGNTPIHLACEEDREDVALILVQYGAKLGTHNKEKKTPIDLCAPGGLKTRLLEFIKDEEFLEQKLNSL